MHLFELGAMYGNASYTDNGHLQNNDYAFAISTSQPDGVLCSDRGLHGATYLPECSLLGAVSK